MTDLAARYVAAERLLPHQWPALVNGGVVRPCFLPDGRRFWYRSTRGPRAEHLLVDPDAGTVQPLLDLARLAEELRGVTGEDVDLRRLELGDLVVTDDAMWLSHAGQRVQVDLPSLSCRTVGAAAELHEKVSPNGRWAASVRDHDVVVRDLRTGEERRLTDDGTPDRSYATLPQCNARSTTLQHFGMRPRPALLWAPDSSRLVTHRLDERAVSTMHLIRSTPRDGGRPVDHAYRYAVLGDEHLPVGDLLVLDVQGGPPVVAERGPRLMPFTTPLTHGNGWWHAASGRVLFLDANRTETVVSLNALDPLTGRVQELVVEQAESRVYVAPGLLPPAVRVLESGEVLWWSERTGWGHLYLYDADGRLVHQLTDGPFVVREVVCVDERRRTAVVALAGREPDLDPYSRQLYLLHLDTSELTRLTDDALDHAAVGSPAGVVVDVTSDLVTPASSVVRDADGRVLVELEQADASALLEAGYEPPEPFVVKAADGVTDVHGVLYRPHGLDESGRYPVLDDIYPGPALAPRPVRFPESGAAPAAGDAAAFAALGFAVVVLNARGTPLWSRDFRDCTRGDRYDDLLADHVTALQQLRERHPWMDAARVGIYGTSGGGHASTRALLLHPETFRAAASACGSHDERIYHAMWGERFIGPLGEVDYAARANPSLADSLKGRLLLVHGEMDDNVTPHLTMRLVDALLRADKDVDLLLLPNADHGLGMHRQHWWRRRWDHFVRHLLGQEPPEYHLSPVPLDLQAIVDTLGV